MALSETDKIAIKDIAVAEALCMVTPERAFRYFKRKGRIVCTKQTAYAISDSLNNLIDNHGWIIWVDSKTYSVFEKIIITVDGKSFVDGWRFSDEQ
jgi:hypothetical protein